jgi:hypothetical protein
LKPAVLYVIGDLLYLVCFSKRGAKPRPLHGVLCSTLAEFARCG